MVGLRDRPHSETSSVREPKGGEAEGWEMEMKLKCGAVAERKDRPTGKIGLIRI